MRIKLPAQELRLGMYVSALDVPWEKTSFQFQGFIVNSERDLKLIHAGCRFVYVDVERSSDPSSVAKILQSLHEPKKAPNKKVKQWLRRFWKKRARPISSQDMQSAPPMVVPIEEEVDTAKRLRQHARAHIYQMQQDARLGKIIDGNGAKAVVSGMLDSIVRNPDALMWVTQLKKRDEYTAMHSFNVCVLSLAFGRHLNMGQDALLELGLGGLMHDIGKIRVPLDILNKPGKLTDREFLEMKNHTVYGEKILSTATNVYSSTIDVALSHHERMKGQGYPRGLVEKDLSVFSKMVAIVDMYDAITSDRVYHKGSSALDTVDILYNSRDDSLDRKMVEAFIQCVGIYPVGTLVELSNLEVGVVVSSRPNARLAPQVLVVMDKRKRPFRPHHILDLALEAQRTGGAYVKRALDPGAYNIGVSDLVAESSW